MLVALQLPYGDLCFSAEQPVGLGLDALRRVPLQILQSIITHFLCHMEACSFLAHSMPATPSELLFEAKPCLSSSRFRFASDGVADGRLTLTLTSLLKIRHPQHQKCLEKPSCLFMSSIQGFHIFDCSAGLTLFDRQTVFGKRHTLLPCAEEELFSTILQRHESSQHRVQTAQNLEADLTNIGQRASLQPCIWTENNYTLSCRNRKSECFESSTLCMRMPRHRSKRELMQVTAIR
jgi:hypothetical protein